MKINIFAQKIIKNERIRNLQKKLMLTRISGHSVARSTLILTLNVCLSK